MQRCSGAVPEYDEAFARWTGDSLRALAEVRTPLLEMLGFQEVSSTVASRVQDREGMDLELPARRTSVELSSSVEAIRFGHFEELAAARLTASDDLARQMVEHVMSTLNQVTEATGNVVHAGDRPVFDAVRDVRQDGVGPDRGRSAVASDDHRRPRFR